MCVASLVLCLGLACWQWGQYSATGGSLQNLGYVLQWPLFGLFPVFVFWRIRVLAKRPENQQEQSGDEQAPQERPAVVKAGAAHARERAIPAQDDQPDDELAAYNRYLAELNARAHGTG